MWQTNLPGWGLDNWYNSADHKMLDQLWTEIGNGNFGMKINTGKMHAIGFSSGSTWERYLVDLGIIFFHFRL